MKLIMVGMSMAMMLAACGKSDDSSSSSEGGGDGSGGSESASNSEKPKKPYEDMSKPYLTEARMGKFMESLKEHQNPFEILAKGGTLGALAPGSRVNELNSFARKHGFADSEEYIGAWGRAFATWMAVKMEDSQKLQISGTETMLKSTEEQMKNPDLSPEMKKAAEDQAKMLREQIAEFKKPRETGVPAQDLEVMRKHAAAYEAALNEKKKGS